MGFLDRFKKKTEPEQPTYTPPEPKKFSVLMQDGTIEEYDERFFITDGKNCVVCDSGYYHTFFDCRTLQIEAFNNQIRAMDVREAKKQHYEYCPECKELAKDWL